MKILAVGINARFTHSCLALFYLREALQHQLPGVEVAIRQFTINDPCYDILQRLTDETADYLFFSAVIWNSSLVEQLIEDLFMFPACPPIVVGGPQAEVVGSSFADRKSLTVFNGAIEAAGADFYRDLQDRALKKRYQASFFAMPGEKRFASPYRAADFAGPLKHRAVYYESSRGCPFSCIYCLSSAEKGLYHHDLAQVRAELSTILAHRPKTLRFVDRTFNDNPRRALEIWRFLAEQGGETLFHFELAPDRFTDEMFCFLETVEVGRFQFEVGLQSTHPETLKRIRRPVDPVVAGDTIRRLRRLENIHLHVDLILGLPFETPESFAQSVNDVYAMQPHYIQMGLLKILPGTEMARAARQYGYLFSARPPYPVFANRWLTADILRDLFRLGQCVEHFGNNRFFVSLWRYLVATGEDMAGLFAGLARMFLRRGYFFKAATQETLSELLLEHLRGRRDFQLCRGLLVYDWLRCGHRFLPAHLQSAQQNGESLEELRLQLYHRLPAYVDGLYDWQGRNHFIKKHVFHRFSGEVLRAIGFHIPVAPASSVVCFSPERERAVFRLNKAMLIEIND